MRKGLVGNATSKKKRRRSPNLFYRIFEKMRRLQMSSGATETSTRKVFKEYHFTLLRDSTRDGCRSTETQRFEIAVLRDLTAVAWSSGGRIPSKSLAIFPQVRSHRGSIAPQLRHCRRAWGRRLSVGIVTTTKEKSLSCRNAPRSALPEDAQPQTHSKRSLHARSRTNCGTSLAAWFGAFFDEFQPKISKSFALFRDRKI